MRDITTNFFASALAVGLSATATSMTLTTGSGALLPVPSSGILRLVVDAEIVIVTARAGDTLTVTRGQENTTAAIHGVGAMVQLAMTAGMLNHLWTNVADTFQPDVPPNAFNLLPSVWDDEFESASGLWTFYPLDYNASVDYGGITPSWLTFVNPQGQTQLYYLYQAFAPASAFTLTTRVSQSGTTAVSGAFASVTLFVSDQSSPTGGVLSGNRVLVTRGLDTRATLNVTTALGAATTWPASVITTRATQNGAPYGASFSLLDSGYAYLRVVSDGNGGWTLAVSDDGVTYLTVAVTTLALTPRSAGLILQSNANQTVKMDWWRVTS